MKTIVKFFAKTVALSSLLSQTTTSYTGYELMSNPLNEPVFLTLCGLGLLALGILGQKGSGGI